MNCGGGGTQSRSRACDSPPPSNGGANCTGNFTEIQDCGTDPCPGTILLLIIVTHEKKSLHFFAVDGGFGNWTAWSTCTVNCGGGGTQSRSRACDSPPPANGGANCTGNFTEIEECGTDPCPGIFHISNNNFCKKN